MSFFNRGEWYSIMGSGLLVVGKWLPGIATASNDSYRIGINGLLSAGTGTGRSSNR